MVCAEAVECQMKSAGGAFGSEHIMTNGAARPQMPHRCAARLEFTLHGRENQALRGKRHVPDISFDIDQLTPVQLNALMAGAVAVGTLYCFLGYRTLKFVIALTGFLLAGSVAGLIALWLTRGNELAGLVAFGLGGISGAFALFFLYRAGIFLLGLLWCTLIASNVFGSTEQDWEPLIVLGVGVVGGLLALILEKPVMLIATSVLGAWILVCCGAFFLQGGTDLEIIRETLRSEEHRTYMLGTWVVLSIAGVLSQFATTRNFKITKKSAPAAS